MDSLTYLLDMAGIRAELDLRCRLSGVYEIPHPAATVGIAPFHFILAGGCRIEANGRWLRAQAGDFVLLPGGGTHVIHDDGASGLASLIRASHDGFMAQHIAGEGPIDADFLCGHIRYFPGAGDLLFNALPNPLHVSLASEESHSLKALVDLMRSEADGRLPGAMAIITALTQTLLSLALRRCGERPDGEGSVLALMADVRLAASTQALLKEPGKPWTIDTLSELSAMSRATYVRRFRQTSGMNVFDFLTRTRMATACDLLRRTKRNVNDIAATVGYQSEGAFSKAFRQYIGEPPGRYRRSRLEPHRQ